MMLPAITKEIQRPQRRPRDNWQSKRIENQKILDTKQELSKMKNV